MRAIYSYGVALVIVLVLAVWMASGILVTGGQGPGNGEKPIVGLTAPDETITPEQRSLLEQAQAKQDAAAEAKKVADAAAEEARLAAVAADEADTSGLEEQEKLKAELEARSKAADEAKHAEEMAVASATAAEEAAVAAEEALNAFKTISERISEGDGAGTAPPPRSVRVEVVTAQNMPIEVPLRGRTKAKSAIEVVAQTGGIVQTVAIKKGDSVNAGDTLCTLDQGARKLAVDQAQAAVDQAQSAYNVNLELVQKGVAAPNTTLAVEAQLKGAQAQLQNAQLELGRTTIKSDVAGVVADPLANVGSMLGMGQTCATIVELDPMLFVASVPEARIQYARLGLKAAVTTITGDKAEGTVTYIAPTADDATRSFPVEIDLPNADLKLRDGITAEAVVNVGTAPVHVLKQSMLTLDDEGVLGIRTVETGSKVAFHPVTIIRDTRDGVWVTGLPFKLNVITVGQEFVQPGQIVDAKTADGEPAAT